MGRVKTESYYVIKVGKMFMTNKTIITGTLALSDNIRNASRWNLRIDVQGNRDVEFNREVESDVIKILRDIQDLGVSDVKVLHREEYYEENEAEYGIVVNMQGLKLGLVKR